MGSELSSTVIIMVFVLEGRIRIHQFRYGTRLLGAGQPVDRFYLFIAGSVLPVPAPHPTHHV